MDYYLAGQSCSVNEKETSVSRLHLVCQPKAYLVGRFSLTNVCSTLQRAWTLVMEMKSHTMCMINHGVKVAALVNIFTVLVETWTRMCMEMILTSWSRPIGIILSALLWIYCMDQIFPEKLIVAELIKIFSTFYGSCSFITILTAACDWFLLWDSWIIHIMHSNLFL